MAEFRPFRGVRFNENRTGDLSAVICPPYDVISPQEQEYYYELHPNNSIRLDLAKVFPQDDEQDNCYSRAGSCFRQWLSEGILVRDDEPAYYLLEEQFDDEHGQPLIRYGVMGLKGLERNSPEASIRPHEATYSGPKKDRLELMKATSANFSPIFSVYQDPTFFMEKVFADTVPDGECVEGVGRDGVRRRLFALKDKDLLEQVETFLSGKDLLIADGHHRYETALTYRDWRRVQEGGPDGSQPYDYTFMYVTNMESPGLCVYPAHRILKRSAGFDAHRFLETVEEIFEVERLGTSRDKDCRERFVQGLRQVPQGATRIGCRLKEPDLFCFLTCNDIEGLEALFPEETPALVRALDVSVLHEIVFGKCLGLSRETQTQEDILAYVKGEGAALDLLERDPELEAAFFLNPAPVQKIMQIAFSGILLPQKTTYFFPKLMTGLVFRLMDGPV